MRSNRTTFFARPLNNLLPLSTPVCATALSLPHTFMDLAAQPDRDKVAALTLYQRKKTAELLAKHPYLYQRTFRGEIAYTHHNKPPMHFIENGGFKRTNPYVDYDVDSGISEGNICLTLGGAGIAAIFTRDNDQKEHYIYAIPLYGTFIMAGSQWGGEVILPGALPLSNTWFVRKITEMKGGSVELGLLMGQRSKMPIILGASFSEYSQQSSIKMPQKIDVGEDFPYEYQVKLTPDIEAIQKDVLNHYARVRKDFWAASPGGMHI